MKPKRRFIDFPRRGKTGIRRFVPSWRQVVVTCLLGLIAVAGAFIAAYYLISVPNPNELLRAQTTVIAYADGTPIAKLFEQNRTNVELDLVPVHTQRAVLAAENRDFYSDPGISVTGAARALWVTLTSDRVQGGSTITQQYVKNMYLTQERSYERKIKEVFISLKIDRELTKDALLGDYLNTIYFGRGAYGIQAASEAYYGKNVTDLNVAESALLAARIQSPVGFDDPDNAAALQARYDYVLTGMVAEGWLTEADRAAQTVPVVRDNSGDVRFAGQAGYLVAATKTELARLGFTEDEIERGGLRVRTTFEPKAQAAAEAAVTAALPPVAEWPENFHAAVAAVRPGTGEVVAIYGGRGYQAGAFFNDAIQGAAQPGSTFKPFALVAGLQNGVSLRDRFLGTNNREFPEYDGGRPVPNFGGESFGNIDLVTATENSVNTAFVDLTIEVGSDKVVQSAVAAGIPEDTQDLIAQPSVVLGVANVRPVDLANAYATLAAAGQRTDWHVVVEVIGADGEVRHAAAPAPEQVIPPEVVSDVSFALQAVVEDGSGFAAQELGRPAAGKTGTTNDNKSSWYAGYVPQLAASVALWEEGADASLAGFGGRETVTGGSFPASVWTAFMQGALDGTEVAEFPEPAYVNDGEDVSDGGSAPPPPATTSSPPSPTQTTTAPPPTETTEPPPTETTEPPPTETTEPPTETTEPPTESPPPTTNPAFTTPPKPAPDDVGPDDVGPDDLGRAGAAASRSLLAGVGGSVVLGALGLFGAAGATGGLVRLHHRDGWRARRAAGRTRRARHRHPSG